MRRPLRGLGRFHILVDDAASARSALEVAGLEVCARCEVLTVDVEDRPGIIGDAPRRIANVGANLDLVYLATNTWLNFGADDLDKTCTAL